MLSRVLKLGEKKDDENYCREDKKFLVTSIFSFTSPCFLAKDPTIKNSFTFGATVTLLLLWHTEMFVINRRKESKERKGKTDRERERERETEREKERERKKRERHTETERQRE